MAKKSCLVKLKKELKNYFESPAPYIPAVHCNERNMLEWHYLIEGPPDTPYHGGWYVGKLRFPPDYPFKPPSIMMLTPNGRFKTGERLCLSMSDFHPESWNPMWSVSTVLTGLLSFMCEDTPTTGAIETSLEEKREFASNSLAYNLQNAQFKSMFPQLADVASSSTASEEPPGDQPADLDLEECAAPPQGSAADGGGAPAESEAGAAAGSAGSEAGAAEGRSESGGGAAEGPLEASAPAGQEEAAPAEAPRPPELPHHPTLGPPTAPAPPSSQSSSGEAPLDVTAQVTTSGKERSEAPDAASTWLACVFEDLSVSREEALDDGAAEGDVAARQSLQAAAALLREGVPEGALESVGEAVRARPGRAVLARALACRSAAHAACGDLHLALDALHQALPLLQDGKQVAAVKGQLQGLQVAARAKESGDDSARQRLYEDACTHYEEAMAAAPHCGPVHCSAAAAYLSLDPAQPQKALQAADAALSIQQQSLKALRRRADSLQALQRYEEAVKAYKTLHKMQPRDMEVKKCLQKAQKAAKASQ